MTNFTQFAAKNILSLVVVLTLIVLPIGCDKPTVDTNTEIVKKSDSNDDHAGHEHDAHAALHKPKHNQIIAEFPGHKYAMEIVENGDSVTAYLTDAHFAPIQLDVQEVKLDFIVDEKPASYTLKRTADESGKPATFTADDKELAELCCDGWHGEAMATFELAGAPYRTKLTKLNVVHDHDHAHDHDHDHAH